MNDTTPPQKPSKKTKRDEIKYLDIGVLQTNPFQPRSKILEEDIEELASSIKTHGVIEPLVVAETPAGYQIIAGERRWRAAQKVGLSELPVVIKKTTPKGMLEMALIENVQRTDLNPIERGLAFRQLSSEFELSLSDIGRRVGKSLSYISNSIKLLDMPDAIKDGLVGGLITEGHARALSGIHNKQLMIRAYKKVIKEGASVRRAEEIARKIKIENDEDTILGKANTYQVDDAEVKKWEEKLKKLMERQAKVKLTRTHKQTKISITLLGTPEETQEDLEKIMELTQK